jgi:hypothetical protein
MTAVMRFFGAWLCLNLRKVGRLAANTTDGAKQLREPPIVLAEVIAASSFLDFGGIPDARYFDTLYDWRHSETGKGSPIVRLKKRHPYYGKSLIFKGSLMKERTFRERGPAGKLLSKFARRVLSAARAHKPCYFRRLE